MYFVNEEHERNFYHSFKSSLYPKRYRVPHQLLFCYSYRLFMTYAKANPIQTVLDLLIVTLTIFESQYAGKSRYPPLQQL